MIEGRSKSVLADWLTQRPKRWRERVEDVAMKGLSWFKTAAIEGLPAAVSVMESVSCGVLGRQRLDERRCRVQAATCLRRRGRKTDPLYRARRTLHTGVDLLTDTQKARLAPSSPSTPMLRSRRPGRCINARGRLPRTRPTKRPFRDGVVDPHAECRCPDLTEPIALWRTLTARADDVLAFFDRPGTSNGRLEHLRGSDLGFLQVLTDRGGISRVMAE